MAARQITASGARPLFSQVCQNLQEYLVILNDRPNTSRTLLPGHNSILSRQTFVGNILRGSKSSTGNSSNARNIQGTVIACRAENAEAVKRELQVHPYAKERWDLSTTKIVVLETVHTSALQS